MIKSFELALYNTLKNIKNKLKEYPTVLFTGGGYHIYQPVYIPTALEYITEFSKFNRPSEQFLRFAKDFLSNGKADKQNNPSFRSCLLRIPGSINSKYGNKVTIVKKWNGDRASITLDLLEGFRIYSIQKKIDHIIQRQKMLNESKRNNININYHYYYGWIEHLLQTGIEDFRKLVIDLILAPYLINIKKLSYEESYGIIMEWLDKCNVLYKLDNYRNFDYRIKYALKNAVNKEIGPMSKEKIKTDPAYSELYRILQNKGSLE
ncbi:MAG: DNA primase noncatalytic subunit PriX [Nitrososphaeraceae archaeon]